MIAATINKVNDWHLVTLAIYVKRPNLAPIEHYANALKTSQKEAESWAITQYKIWLKNQVKSFLVMRKNAYLKVGMLSQDKIRIIDAMHKISEQPSLTSTCLFIVKHQEVLKALCPNQQSSQHYLSYLIEELIIQAHAYACLNTKICNFS